MVETSKLIGIQFHSFHDIFDFFQIKDSIFVDIETFKESQHHESFMIIDDQVFDFIIKSMS